MINKGSKKHTGQNKPLAPASAEPTVRSLFRRLETLEREHDATATHTGNARWMIPYADLLTLLLGFFVVMFAASQIPPEPDAAQKQASQKAFVQESPQDRGGAEGNAPPKAIAYTSPQHREGAGGNGPQKPTEKADAKLAANLQATLDKVSTLDGVIIRPQERGLVISLKDSILFAPGSADLSPAAREKLDVLMGRLTDQLATLPGGKARPIRVEGHTDNTPIATVQYPSNWELSTARATNIVRYLLAERRFTPEQLSAVGYGEFKPVADNSSIEGKQKNRRVDIVVLNSEAANQEPPVQTAPVDSDR